MAFDITSVLLRDNQVPNYTGADFKPAGVNNRGAMIVQQDLPPKAEAVRLGQTWEVRIRSNDAFTFVAALPTTRAELVLYNGEGSGGKSYVIDAVWCLGITSMAAAGSIALIAQIVPAATAPTDDANQLLTGRSGRTYAGSARKAVAQTTMTANKWSLLQTSIAGGSATAQIGLASYADVAGGIILKPGDMLGVNAVAGTAAGTAVMGIVWHEAQLTLPT